MKDILSINAHLKYVEHLLSVFDSSNDKVTLGEIRGEFEKKFGTKHILLNQHFGIYRLLPLILMKEEYKKQKKELSGDILTIKVIRDAVAHHNFTISKQGYKFQNDKKTISLTYKEFNDLLYRVEKSFYIDGKG